MVLLAAFALLLQTIAPLSPMPPRKITTIEDLAWALSDICTTGTRNGSPGPVVPDRFHGCQICIGIDLAGHYITPPANAPKIPAGFGRTAWQTSPSTVSTLVRAVGVQPRGPPPII
jgi:hypothetical protein